MRCLSVDVVDELFVGCGKVPSQDYTHPDDRTLLIIMI